MSNFSMVWFFAAVGVILLVICVILGLNYVKISKNIEKLRVDHQNDCDKIVKIAEERDRALKIVAENQQNASKLDAIIAAKQEALEDLKHQFQVYSDTVTAQSTKMVSISGQIDENTAKLNELVGEIAKKEKQIAALQVEVSELTDKSATVCNEYKLALIRAANEQIDGYKLQFTPQELEELKELNEICDKIKRPEVLCKAIYTIYYAPKLSAMVGLAGVNGVSGIYRIYHVVDGQERSYIGQAVDIGKRWGDHLKRATGCDDTAAIKLYPAMKAYGVDNFKWEVVETCKKELLSERERYWGAFYSVKETGYNTKLG